MPLMEYEVRRTAHYIKFIWLIKEKQKTKNIELHYLILFL